MGKTIYVQDGATSEDLLAQNETYNANGELRKYNATYNEQLIVDMPFLDQGDSIDMDYLKTLAMEDKRFFFYILRQKIINGEQFKLSTVVNPQGWLRSGGYYFAQLYEKYPDAFSLDNIKDIKKGKAPKLSQEFVDYFNLEEYRPYIGEMLIHHHIGEDGQAIALPETIHPGYGGIHNVEKNIGVTKKATEYSNKVQEAYKAGYIQAGDYVWCELKNDTEL